ncbi:hypothetical protein D2962_06065 [Biomaibacter acetigenes]|uniref:Uncharacterized protein n=1 Tax=Biomaibacter acetigenes TaxID=2316383 RepID=A0A3G2R4E9_9FIRM|nr:hypothetical protein [Biomaibacter acetigenes]AYO30241.1 hypothetical protein D2962_06065 [Biomaibacter acetigenes]
MNKAETVEDFIRRLDVMSGTGNGIGKVTVEKIRKFAEKEGFIKQKDDKTLKPDGVTNENIETQLIEALEKAIQLILDVSIRKTTVPYDTLHRWENLIQYARKNEENGGRLNDF